MILLVVTYSWRTTLATLARPYAYSRFGKGFGKLVDNLDREIQQKRRAFDNQTGNLDSYNQINESLIDIHNIMRKNIDEVVQRVEKLDRRRVNTEMMKMKMKMKMRLMNRCFRC